MHYARWYIYQVFVFKCYLIYVSPIKHWGNRESPIRLTACILGFYYIIFNHLLPFLTIYCTMLHDICTMNFSSCIFKTSWCNDGFTYKNKKQGRIDIIQDLHIVQW